MTDSRRRLQAGLRQPVIYGREAERARLRKLLDETLAGRGRIALVYGEAGIGKTTLVGELAQMAQSGSCSILTGGCYAVTVTPPYGLWSELIEDFEAGPGDPEPPAWLVERGHEWQARSERDLAGEIRSFLAEVAVTKPLVVILEDLHWSDLTSIEVLRAVSRHIHDLPILIVATYRDDEIRRGSHQSDVLGAIARDRITTRIPLSSLDAAAMADLIVAELPYLSVADDGKRALAAEIARLAGGNPFFAVELLRAAGDPRVFESGRDDGRTGLIALPELVQDVVDRHLEGLRPGTLEALEAASVIGSRIPYDLWASILPQTDQELVAAIHEARDAGVLIEHPDGGRLSFNHELTREALYRRMVIPERRRWHRLVAQELASGYRSQAATVAGHFARSGDPRAIDWLVRAAGEAWRVYARRSAAEQLELAIQMMEQHEPDAPEIGWLDYRLACALIYTDPDSSKARLERAAAIARESGNRMLQGYADFQLGGLLCTRGEMAEGLSRLEAGVLMIEEMTMADAARAGRFRSSLEGGPLSISEQEAASWPRLNPARGNLAVWLPAAGRLEEARTTARQFLDDVDTVYGDAGPHDREMIEAVADGCFGLAMAAAMLGRPEEASAAFTRAREGYAAIGYSSMAAYMLAGDLIWVRQPYSPDDPAAGNRLRHQMDELFAALDEEEDLNTSRRGLALQHHRFYRGEWEDVEPSPFPFWRWLGIDLAYCQIQRWRGCLDQAWARVNEMLPAGPETEPGTHDIVTAFTMAQVATELSLESGDAGSAARWLAMLDRWLDQTRAAQFSPSIELLRARKLALAEERDQARQSAAHAQQEAEQPRQPLVLAAIHRFLGVLDREAGRLGSAREAFEQSLALAESCDAPLERARTLIELSELMVETGNSAEKVDEGLGQAEEIARRLGTRPLLDRIDDLRNRSPAAPRSWLTPRQIEVLELIAEGLTDRQIGESLGISHRTVMRHVTGILNALGVDSRTAAAASAIRNGII